MRQISLHRQLLGVALLTVLVLLVPFVASRLSPEVRWGAEDFVAAGSLLIASGCSLVLVFRWVAAGIARAVSVAGVLVLFALVWAELAVGLLH